MAASERSGGKRLTVRGPVDAVVAGGDRDVLGA